MDTLPRSKIVVTQQAHGTAFDFPSPLAPVSARQFLRQSGAVVSLACGVVASLVILAAGAFVFVRVGLAEIALFVLFMFAGYVAITLFMREDAIFRVATSLKLVFGGELARREAARTRRLCGSQRMLTRITWAGETQVWNRDKVADIRAETCSTEEGVVMSIVLIDSSGLRFVLHSNTLSAFDFLADRMEMASIAARLRDVLHLPAVHDLPPEDAIPPRQLFAEAIRDKTLEVDKERITAAQPVRRFSIFRRVFSPPRGNNRT